MTDEQRRRNVGGMLAGVTIMAVGLLLMLDQTGIVYGLGWRHLWPVMLIVIGLARFATPRRNGRRDGGWMVFIGSLFLLDTLHVLRFRDSWPLFIVAIGLGMVWRELGPRRAPRACERVE